MLKKEIKSKGDQPILVLAMSALLILSQCTFAPKDEYISPILPPEPIQVIFEVNDPAFKDPYYLLGLTRFYFRLKDLDNLILFNEVRLNGSVINSSITDNGIDFILNPGDMEIGSHSVEMILYVDTQSGSLANQLGGEYYEIKQTFMVIIDPEPPTFSSFSARMENGYLTLRWNETTKKNFVYTIKRGGPAIQFLSDSIIYDTRANFFVDPGFVGGTLMYQVIASGYGFTKVVGEGTFQQAPGDLTMRKDNKGVVRLTWSQSFIDTDRVEMRIQTFTDGGKEIFKPFGASGNIPIDTLRLMEELTVYVNLFRKGYESQATQLSWQLLPTPNLKPFKAMAMLKDQNKLLIATETTIYRYALDGLVLEDSLSLEDHGIVEFGSFTVCSDESTGFVSGGGTRILRFNPSNFTDVAYHDIELVTREFTNQLFPIFATSIGNASTNGLLTLAFRREKYYAMILDFTSGDVVWHSAPENEYPPTISNDGEYFAVDLSVPYADYEGWIYQRNGDQYTSLGKIDHGDHAFLTNGNEIISFRRIEAASDIFKGVYVSVYNFRNVPQPPSTSFIKVRGADIPYELEQSNLLHAITYDPFTNFIAFRYNNSTKLMNPATLGYEKTIEGSQLIFSNNYILMTNGFIEQVQ